MDWSRLKLPGVGWSGLEWVGAQFDKALKKYRTMLKVTKT